MERIKPDKVFGTVIKKLRNVQGISQEKLADLCDLDRTYISLIERGLRQPTLRTIFKLSKALNISPSKLIKLVEDEIDENT